MIYITNIIWGTAVWCTEMTFVCPETSFDGRNQLKFKHKEEGAIILILGLFDWRTVKGRTNHGNQNVGLLDKIIPAFNVVSLFEGTIWNGVTDVFINFGKCSG